MAIIYNKEDSGALVGRKRVINRWIKSVAAVSHYTVGDLSIITCSDSYIHKMNVQYLGHDYATDIITFDYSECSILSGDLFISTDTVRSNAKRYGVLFHVELHRVIIHGVLHLMGYKDKSKSDAAEMRRQEDAALLLLEKILRQGEGGSTTEIAPVDVVAVNVKKK